MIIVTSKKQILWSFIIFAAIIFSTVIIYKAAHQTYVDAEIFNIDKGQVTKTLIPSKITRNDVKGYLHDITGIYTKTDPLPDNGYIVKINLKQEIRSNNRWLNNFIIKGVKNLFIIFPEKGSPFMLILDKSERPYFFNFDSSIDKLKKIIDPSS